MTYRRPGPGRGREAAAEGGVYPPRHLRSPRSGRAGGGVGGRGRRPTAAKTSRCCCGRSIESSTPLTGVKPGTPRSRWKQRGKGRLGQGKRRRGVGGNGVVIVLLRLSGTRRSVPISGSAARASRASRAPGRAVSRVAPGKEGRRGSVHAQHAWRRYGIVLLLRLLSLHARSLPESPPHLG